MVTATHGKCKPISYIAFTDVALLLRSVSVLFMFEGVSHFLHPVLYDQYVSPVCIFKLHSNASPQLSSSYSQYRKPLHSLPINKSVEFLLIHFYLNLAFGSLMLYSSSLM